MRLLIFISFILLSTGSMAQRDNAMFWNSYSFVNPALTASKFKHQAYLDYRNVVANTSDLFGSYNAKIEKLKTGLGLCYNQVINEYQTSKNLMLNSAYYLPMKDISSKLSFGLNAGLIFSRINELFEDTAGNNFAIPDKTLFSFDAGISYQSENLLFGLAVKNIGAPNHDDAESGVVYAYFPREFNLQFDYNITLGEKFDLVARSVASYMQQDEFFFAMFNAQLQYKKKYMIGCGYNSKNNFSFQLNWDAKKKFRAGYSMELLKIDGATKSSHEAVLGFILDGKK